MTTSISFKVHGFTQEQSIRLLEEYESVAAVMEAPFSAKGDFLKRNSRLFDGFGGGAQVFLTRLSVTLSSFV